MFYKSFNEQITRKYGILVEGWPLPAFENPSSIGSQVELRVLLNAWQSDVARFRKMSEREFESWKAEYYDLSPEACPQVTASPLSNANHATHTSSLASPAPAINIVEFDMVSSDTPPANAQKKARKTRSDKGKPRKRRSQVPGELMFLATQ